jgi:hypothetical protein
VEKPAAASGSGTKKSGALEEEKKAAGEIQDEHSKEPGKSGTGGAEEQKEQPGKSG